MSRPIERRLFDASIEVRRSDDGTIGLRGYAALFDVPAHGEVVKRSAFNRTLAQSDDVRLLVNHDGVALARTKSGTMRLSTDDRGLLVEVDQLDPANPTVQELVSAMNRGDVDQMSFAFADMDPHRNDDGMRELREVRLFDVSVVTYPWYDTTSVGLTGDREIDRALVCLRSLTDEQRAEVLADLSPSTIPELAPVAEEPRSYTIAEARALLASAAA